MNRGLISPTEFVVWFPLPSPSMALFSACPAYYLLRCNECWLKHVRSSRTNIGQQDGEYRPCRFVFWTLPQEASFRQLLLFLDKLLHGSKCTNGRAFDDRFHQSFARSAPPAKVCLGCCGPYPGPCLASCWALGGPAFTPLWSGGLQQSPGWQTM